MKCFVHQSNDAVGLCRNCSRGVCTECAVDLSAGIACKGRCEETVEAMAALINRNVALGGKRVGAGHWIQLIFYAVGGLAFFIFGGVILAGGGEASAPLGAILVICGLLFMGLAYNYIRWIGAAKSKTKSAT